ncbi:UNVERIFIED_CONTAM: hypothetical protein HDU68_001536, partial [Siphonaria sp. JEL0065]
MTSTPTAEAVQGESDTHGTITTTTTVAGSKTITKKIISTVIENGTEDLASIHSDAEVHDPIVIQNEETIIGETGEIVKEITVTETHQVTSLKPVEVVVEEAEKHYEETVMEEGELDIAWLAGEIRSNAGIAALELNDDELATEDIVLISEALHVNTTLEKLDLQGNEIKDDGLLAIAAALSINTHLRELYIGHQQCIARVHVERALAAAIIKNEHLLVFTYSFQDASLRFQVNEALRRNASAYAIYQSRKNVKTIYVTETTEVTTVKKEREIVKTAEEAATFLATKEIDGQQTIIAKEPIVDEKDVAVTTSIRNSGDIAEAEYSAPKDIIIEDIPEQGDAATESVIITESVNPETPTPLSTIQEGVVVSKDVGISELPIAEVSKTVKLEPNTEVPAVVETVVDVVDPGTIATAITTATITKTTSDGNEVTSIVQDQCTQVSGIAVIAADSIVIETVTERKADVPVIESITTPVEVIAETADVPSVTDECLPQLTKATPECVVEGTSANEVKLPPRHVIVERIIDSDTVSIAGYEPAAEDAIFPERIIKGTAPVPMISDAIQVASVETTVSEVITETVAESKPKKKLGLFGAIFAASPFPKGTTTIATTPIVATQTVDAPVECTVDVCQAPIVQETVAQVVQSNETVAAVEAVAPIESSFDEPVADETLIQEREIVVLETGEAPAETVVAGTVVDTVTVETAIAEAVPECATETGVEKEVANTPAEVVAADVVVEACIVETVVDAVPIEEAVVETVVVEESAPKKLGLFGSLFGRKPAASSTTKTTTTTTTTTVISGNEEGAVDEEQVIDVPVAVETVVVETPVVETVVEEASVVVEAVDVPVERVADVCDAPVAVETIVVETPVVETVVEEVSVVAEAVDVPVERSADICDVPVVAEVEEKAVAAPVEVAATTAASETIGAEITTEVITEVVTAEAVETDCASAEVAATETVVSETVVAETIVEEIPAQAIPIESACEVVVKAIPETVVQEAPLVVETADSPAEVVAVELATECTPIEVVAEVSPVEGIAGTETVVVDESAKKSSIFGSIFGRKPASSTNTTKTTTTTTTTTVISGSQDEVVSVVEDVQVTEAAASTPIAVEAIVEAAETVVEEAPCVVAKVTEAPAERAIESVVVETVEEAPVEVVQISEVQVETAAEVIETPAAVVVESVVTETTEPAHRRHGILHRIVETVGTAVETVEHKISDLIHPDAAETEVVVSETTYTAPTETVVSETIITEVLSEDVPIQTKELVVVETVDQVAPVEIIATETVVEETPGAAVQEVVVETVEAPVAIVIANAEANAVEKSAVTETVVTEESAPKKLGLFGARFGRRPSTTSTTTKTTTTTITTTTITGEEEIASVVEDQQIAEVVEGSVVCETVVEETPAVETVTVETPVVLETADVPVERAVEVCDAPVVADVVEEPVAPVEVVECKEESVEIVAVADVAPVAAVETVAETETVVVETVVDETLIQEREIVVLETGEAPAETVVAGTVVDTVTVETAIAEAVPECATETGVEKEVANTPAEVVAADVVVE